MSVVQVPRPWYSVMAVLASYTGPDPGSSSRTGLPACP